MPYNNNVYNNGPAYRPGIPGQRFGGAIVRKIKIDPYNTLSVCVYNSDNNAGRSKLMISVNQ